MNSDKLKFLTAVKQRNLHDIKLLVGKLDVIFANARSINVCRSDDVIAPNIENNFAIRYSCEHGFTEIVVFLVSCILVDRDAIASQSGKFLLDPTVNEDEPIRLASRNGHLSIVKILVSIPSVNPAAQNNYALRWACRNKHYSVVKFLCELIKVPDISVRRSKSLSGKNNGGSVITGKNNEAVNTGDKQVTRAKSLMLVKDPNQEFVVDPTDEDNEAIRWASEVGATDIVALLLTLPGVDPLADDNYAFIMCCANGHLETAKLLLEHGADPTADNNAPLKLACEEGRTAIIELLLSYNVNVSVSNNLPLRNAVRKNHLEIVKLLLNTGKTNPGDNGNECIIQASKRGFLEIVKLLLTYRQVNPGVKNNKPLIEAVRNNHLEVAKILVTHPDVNPFAQNNKALTLAKRNFNKEMEKLLSSLL